jgi:hypothetical protein
VEAPKERFSRPIVVPIALDFESKGAEGVHVEEVVVAVSGESHAVSAVDVVTAVEAPLDRLTLDVLAPEPASTALDVLFASADAQDADPLATPREIPAEPIAPVADPAVPPPVPIHHPASSLAQADDADASEAPPTVPSMPPAGEFAVATGAPEPSRPSVAPAPVPGVRPAAPIEAKTRSISWVGFLLALGLVALGGTVASWVAVRHLPAGRVPTVFR